MDVYRDVTTAEVALRELIRELLASGNGEGWISNSGLTDGKIRGLRDRQQRDRARRGGSAATGDLLEYTQLSDLIDILDQNWELFAECLASKESTLLYLRELHALRNAQMHGRDLLPFESHLVAGIAGQLRNRITLYRTNRDSIHYPRIERAMDSLGFSVPHDGTVPYWSDRWDRGTGQILQIGETIEFSAAGWDPAGLELRWFLGTFGFPGIITTHKSFSDASQQATLPLDRIVDQAVGDNATLSWTVEPSDVGERVNIGILLVGDGDYHLRGSFDDGATFSYRVVPPRDRRRPTGI